MFKIVPSETIQSDILLEYYVNMDLKHNSNSHARSGTLSTEV